jgi:hypothetical protein
LINLQAPNREGWLSIQFLAPSPTLGHPGLHLQLRTLVPKTCRTKTDPQPLIYRSSRRWDLTSSSFTHVDCRLDSWTRNASNCCLGLDSRETSTTPSRLLTYSTAYCITIRRSKILVGTRIFVQHLVPRRLPSLVPLRSLSFMANGTPYSGPFRSATCVKLPVNSGFPSLETIAAPAKYSKTVHRNADVYAA